MKTYTSLVLLATFASANTVTNSNDLKDAIDENEVIQYHQKNTQKEDPTADETSSHKCNSECIKIEDIISDKSCGCSNGVPATGEDCLNDGDNSCSECNEGFHLGGKAGANKCYHNICKCNNGEASGTGSDKICKVHDQSQCESCKPGFHLSGDKCYHNRCSCENGEGVISHLHRSNTGEPAICENHDDAKCFACKFGYALSDFQCIKMKNQAIDLARFDKCACQNGSPIDDKCDLDKYNNGQNCETCNEGFHRGGVDKRKLCYHNQCQCDNGEAWKTTVNQTCVNHGSKNECKSCDTGFFMGGTNGDRLCYHRQCKCENGEGVSTNLPEADVTCGTNHENRCFKCDSGYELVDFECRKLCDL